MMCMKNGARLLALGMLATIAAPGVVAAAGKARVADAGSPTVLVTGSNRGIGLALVQHYAGAGWNVIATCRNPREADELQALGTQNPQVIVEKLDVADHKAIEKLAARYQGTPIDLLINNAALLGDLPKQKVGGLDYAQFEEIMKGYHDLVEFGRREIYKIEG